MSQVKLKDREIMMFKAKRDYEAAILLYRNELEEQAIYQFHQSAEKALKSYLIYKKTRLIKTHDLTMLLDICLDLDSSFEFLRNETENLTPYATIYRYMDMGFGLSPDTDKIEESKMDSIKVIEFIEEKFKEF